MRFSTYILLLNLFFLSCDPFSSPEVNFKDGFINVISPKGGEVWDMGTTQTIAWSFNYLGESSNFIPSSFTIDLYNNNELANNIATVNDGYSYHDDLKLWKGSYNWLIPISLSELTKLNTSRPK